MDHAPDREEAAGAVPAPRHFYLIDLFRGAAALSVLIWHYQHFYYLQPGGPPTFASRSAQPLYAFLQPFYEHGGAAVQFFWQISGFVLACRYSMDRPSGSTFLRNRFARLYPLHLLTLCVVAGLQALSLKLAGAYQIYPYNDAYHFGLNLLFASNWGLERGSSFNAPIWSVSVEVVISALFWLLLPFLFRWRILLAAAVSGLAFALMPLSKLMFFDCAFNFFLGVISYQAFAVLAVRKLLLRAACCLAIALGAALGLTKPPPMALSMAAFLLLLASLESTRLGRVSRAMRWVGDNTYGAYLWHIPIQIAALTTIAVLGVDRRVVDSPAFLLGFIALVSLVARLSFVLIEKPAQKLLRAPSSAP